MGRWFAMRRAWLIDWSVWFARRKIDLPLQKLSKKLLACLKDSILSFEYLWRGEVSNLGFISFYSVFETSCRQSSDGRPCISFWSNVCSGGRPAISIWSNVCPGGRPCISSRSNVCLGRSNVWHHPRLSDLDLYFKTPSTGGLHSLRRSTVWGHPCDTVLSRRWRSTIHGWTTLRAVDRGVTRVLLTVGQT